MQVASWLLVTAMLSTPGVASDASTGPAVGPPVEVTTPAVVLTQSRTGSSTSRPNPRRFGVGGDLNASARGVGAMAPTAIKIDERTKPLENNDFTLLDIDSEGISVRQFAWQKSMGIGVIDKLNPISSFRL